MIIVSFVKDSVDIFPPMKENAFVMELKYLDLTIVKIVMNNVLHVVDFQLIVYYVKDLNENLSKDYKYVFVKGAIMLLAIHMIVLVYENNIIKNATINVNTVKKIQSYV